ncbi:peptidoglycan DD-metalloendopeptidase family protein [Ottowia sp.]|uniref:peptidoglycan DD-metalloendopeptidase family protein n=1 Tax=Ottowia sp. TaxID=1898956 RepID=UPI003A8AE28E
MQVTGRKTWVLTALVAAVVLSACSSTAVNRAPVEDRGMSAGTANGRTPVDPATLPGAENAGKPGYYTVRQGDTIMKIATEVNQPWRDIGRWNNLENPNVIEVGQVLRVVPPTGAAATTVAATSTEPVRTASTSSASTPAKSNGATSAATSSSSSSTPVATQTTSSTSSTSSSTPPSAGADDVDFIWPASGSVLTGFDEVKNKGLAIGGKAGDSVLAAADGRVVYAGAGLRGYGNLVILKHNNTFLTAYAHNQTLLVKEDQSVKKGQKIAEMGSTDADRVKLHFEIRRSGKPVDPARYLPSR